MAKKSAIDKNLKRAKKVSNAAARARALRQSLWIGHFQLKNVFRQT